jgi:putative ABC transport system permease protein
MACTVLIFLWVQYQKSFDRFQENADQICRAYYTNEAFEGSAIYLPGPLAGYLKENYPEIVESTNYKQWKQKVAVGDKSYLSTGSYVDPSFLKMFTFPFIKGDPRTALNNPNSIVMIEDLAQKFFGEEDPLGKTVSYYVFSQKMDMEVTGVIRNVPRNSHLQFDFLIPYEIGYDWMKTWNNNSGWIYVMLNRNSSYLDVSEKAAGVLKIHRPESADILHLQPLEKIHLYLPGGTGLIVYVYIFSVMALILLLIACVNFMNLSTARSEKRFKEIGIKKVVGSSRAQLIKQFLMESMVLASTAMIAALILAQIALPTVNAMLGTQLELIFDTKFILILMAVVLFTGTVAGSYPAFYLSAIQMDKLYETEQLTARLTRNVSIPAILISCLGLLALASFSVERRTKEIGIRKVLGSSGRQIVYMLAKDFTKWVIFANIIAWPLAYLVLIKWLKNFAFRVEIDLGTFVLSGALALEIAVLVIGYHTLRAATADPVKALRYE